MALLTICDIACDSSGREEGKDWRMEEKTALAFLIAIPMQCNARRQ